MNSAVGPSFKVIFAEFKYLRVSWTVHGTHRKKRRRAKQRVCVAIQTQPKILFILFFYGCLVGGVFFLVLNSYYFLPLSFSSSGSLSHNKSTRSVRS